MLNAAIPLQTRQRPRTNFAAEMAQALAIKQARAQLQAHQDASARNAALKESLAATGGDLNAAAQVMLKGGHIDAGTQLLKSIGEMDSNRLKLEGERLDMADRLISRATPENWSGIRQQLIQLDPDDADYPEQVTPEWLESARESVLSVKDRIDLRLRERGQQITMRGQDMTAASAAAGRAVTQSEGDLNRAAAGERAATSEAGKTFDRAKKLRDEYGKFSGDFIKVRDALGRIDAASSDPSPSGDLALVFNFMKMLDPGSTVMQGEYAAAAAAAGGEERLKALYQRLLTGETLTPKMRRDFQSRARKLFNSANRSHEKRVREYTRLARRARIDPQDVIVDISADEPATEAAEGATGMIIDWSQLK